MGRAAYWRSALQRRGGADGRSGQARPGAGAGQQDCHIWRDADPSEESGVYRELQATEGAAGLGPGDDGPDHTDAHHVRQVRHRDAGAEVRAEPLSD
ncbi:hypothetical protein DC007_14650 [Enterococcus faecalis]|nr:hypothetical protein DC007_14650 [Enterococcus faecalis]